MKEKYSFLTKNVLLFAISGVLPKVLAFIIVPIYTAYLSTEEYGVYDLIHTTVDLLVPIFALRIHDAVIRFSLDKEIEPKEVFSIGMKITYAGTFVIGILTFIVSTFNILDKTYLLAFFLLYFVIANANVITRFCRAINKTPIITISSIVNSVVMYSATLVFLLIFNWGLNGFLFANILGYFSSIIVCFFGAKLYRYLTRFTSAKLRNQMIKFSFPLIFSALAWWVNNASDRYMLSWICSVSISGIYAVSYKIPSLLAVVQDIFMQAWSISAIKDFDKDDSDGFIGNIYTILQLCMVIAASLLMLLNLPIAKIIYGSEFYDAWKFVPPLLISLYFNAMSQFIDGLFMALNKTKNIAWFTMLGAVINTITNFVLISLWGAYGAALATMMGFCCAYLMRIFYAKKIINMKKNKAREFLTLLILFIQMLVSFAEWKAVPVHLLALLMLVLLYWKEEKQILVLVKDKMRK